VRSQRWDERGGKDYDVKETNSYPEDFTLTLADMLEFKLSPVVSKTGKGSGRPIYLDMQAQTPMDLRVLDRPLPFLTEQYGNSHCRTHS
jgi:hypothetical protein